MCLSVVRTTCWFPFELSSYHEKEKMKRNGEFLSLNETSFSFLLFFFFLFLRLFILFGDSLIVTLFNSTLSPPLQFTAENVPISSLVVRCHPHDVRQDENWLRMGIEDGLNVGTLFRSSSKEKVGPTGIEMRLKEMAFLLFF